MKINEEDFQNTKLRQMAEAIKEKLRNDPYWEEQRRKQEAEKRAQEEQERLMREESERIRRYRAMQEDSIRYFMKEAPVLRFDPKDKTPSAVLYDGYCRWCEERNVFPESLRAFCLNLKKNARDYKIAPTNFNWQGRHIRGFRGVALTEAS